jgi:hypothetical protein
MNDVPNEKKRDAGQEVPRLKSWGASIFIFLSAAVLLVVAWLLWITHNLRAQGAAIALVGVAATHLVKEVQELLRFWLKGA